VLKRSVVEVVGVERLVGHSGSVNEMGRTAFLKLVRNIGGTGLYAPLIVRPHPEREGDYEIIDGHQRLRALQELGYEEADVIVWEANDEETDILLGTLNRLRGRDNVGKRAELLRRLKERRSVEELGRVLPERAGQIERLLSARRPVRLAETEKVASPVVFFVEPEQKKLIERAIAGAEKGRGEKTKAARRAGVLAEMAVSLMTGEQP
jgi:ParB-like chromosome segregation protein Spo0J